MTLQNRQNKNGWRTIITDDDSHERWTGNFAPTEAEARENAIDGFVGEKKEQAKVLDDKIWIIEKSIEKLRKMKKLWIIKKEIA